MARFVRLSTGDPAPLFRQRSPSNPDFNFDTVAGRYVVLCFFASSARPTARRAIEAALRAIDVFDDARASFFGVSADPEDAAPGRLPAAPKGVRFFLDHDLKVSRLYGAAAIEPEPDGRKLIEKWVVLDPMLRVLIELPCAADGGDADRALAVLRGLPAPDRHAGPPLTAPDLIAPRILEPELCRALMGLYEARGGAPSGFMREVDGVTGGVHNPLHKSRRDCEIEDPDLIAALRIRIHRRLAPGIERAFQFRATRMERYIVACYDAAEGGHFSPHRDNTTRGTAHRRFAVTINLNDDYDGGDLIFPEFGSACYRAPVGGAIVFSCSLLHTVNRMRRGRRFAFLPFLYDEAAERIRDENLAFVAEANRMKSAPAA